MTIRNPSSIAHNATTDQPQTALHLAIDRSILSLYLKSISSGPLGLSILERYYCGETDLLNMSFEVEAHLEAAD